MVCSVCWYENVSIRRIQEKNLTITIPDFFLNIIIKTARQFGAFLGNTTASNYEMSTKRKKKLEMMKFFKINSGNFLFKFRNSPERTARRAI
jgi:hypothetical protein